MSLRSPTENEIALTPTQRTGRGVRSEEFLSYPRPLGGKGEASSTQHRNFLRKKVLSTDFPLLGKDGREIFRRNVNGRPRRSSRAARSSFGQLLKSSNGISFTGGDGLMETR